MMNQDGISSGWAWHMLSLFRIVVGLLFVEHGTAKLLGFPHIASYDHLAAFSLIWFAGILELVGGSLIVLGLFTRPVAFLLSGEMAIAYFKVHLAMGPLPLLNHGEAAVFYCWAFLYLVFAGGGAWSLDRLFMGRPGAAQSATAD